MSSSKKFTSKETLRQVFVGLKAQNPIPPKPPYTLYTCILYSLLIHTGKGRGGRVEPERRENGNREEYRSQSWVENTNMTECSHEIGYLQSINSDKHLPQSPFAGHFFRGRHFDFYESYLATYSINDFHHGVQVSFTVNWRSFAVL